MAPGGASVVLASWSIPRFEAAMERRGERLLARLFTPDERTECTRRRRPGEHLAARFAAKVAACRAVGQALAFREIEVVHDPAGAPSFRLTGAAASRVGARTLFLSLSHDAEQAVALVVMAPA